MAAFTESLVLGLVQSLHCAGMCGPLVACSGPRGALGWHGGRLLGYVSGGAIAGTLGARLGAAQLATPGALAALVLGIGLLIAATFGERVLNVPALRRCAEPAFRMALRLPAGARGVALGLCTVLLPCGLLWLALAAAAVSGGSTAGACAMLGFALGTLPLLFAAQLGLRALPSPLRRAVPLAASGLMLWRAWAGLGAHSCCA